jgi:iron complex transport system substrate-binding protein
VRRLLPLLLLLAVGCQPGGCTRPTPDGPTVTDDLGRSVVVWKSPRRIVSLSPAATEILFAIGAGPNVVAGTEFDTYPEEAKALPRVGGFTPQSINIEAIIALKPDLVVAAPQTDTITALEKFGIPVVALDPKGTSDVWKDIELLGKVTGCEAKANEVAEQGRKRFTMPPFNTTGSKQTVLFVLADEPLITSGGGTFIDEIISRSLGKNLFGDLKESWPKVTEEEVLKRDPDVILCVEHTGGDGTIVPGRLKKRPGWDKLKAVKAGKVFAVDADLLTRPGPRLLDGLEVVEKLLRQ